MRKESKETLTYQKMFDKISELLDLYKELFNLERMRAFAPQKNIIHLIRYSNSNIE
ncbi:hypothetical protein KJ733_05680 [Patescibacteria group bacterium]|nr:hypothetical protein [Patescibacteria group bacterium]